jgi:hypothetical protein
MKIKKYSEPYQESTITHLNTSSPTKIEFVKTKTLEDKVNEMNKKLDQILEILKDFEKSK